MAAMIHLIEDLHVCPWNNAEELPVLNWRSTKEVAEMLKPPDFGAIISRFNSEPLRREGSWKMVGWWTKAEGILDVEYCWMIRFRHFTTSYQINKNINIHIHIYIYMIGSQAS